MTEIIVKVNDKVSIHGIDYDLKEIKYCKNLSTGMFLHEVMYRIY